MTLPTKLEVINGHGVVFYYEDETGSAWLSTNMDDLMENFGVSFDSIRVLSIGNDCTAAYWDWWSPDSPS